MEAEGRSSQPPLFPFQEGCLLAALSSGCGSGDPQGAGRPRQCRKQSCKPKGHRALAGSAGSSQSPPSQLSAAALLGPAFALLNPAFADAMAEPRVLKALQEELICSVCLDVYRNPVSLSCGHSFCEECIQGLLRSQRCPQGLVSCPLCSAQEALPTKLQPNIQLRSVVQKFLDTSEQNAALEEKLKREVECEEKGESSDLHDEEIMCDFCLEKPQPAVKTCMNCETSLCQAHLGKHSTKAFLTSHVLVEPCDARVLAERRCAQHGKLLECYCVTDSVCVCMLCCATSSHRSHEIISVEEAFGQAQSDFPKIVQTLKKHETAVNKNLENLLSQQEKIKALERLHRNHVEHSFRLICEQLDRSKTEILGAISDIEEQQLSQIEPWIKEHKEMKDAASRSVQELKALRDQKDPVLFLKGLSAIQARKRKQVPNKDGTELAEQLAIMDESMKNIIQEHFQPYDHLILDAESSMESSFAHEHLTFQSRQACGLHVDDTVLRIAGPSYPFSVLIEMPFWVYSTSCFSSGQHFWEVITRDSLYWKVGVTDNSFQCYLEMSPQHHLRVFLDKRQIKVHLLNTAIRMVRVQLDCERKTVSFFDVSVKDYLGSSRSCVPIAAVIIPASSPVYAIFNISHGSLSLT
ncbi:E3 ubiquitin-protein ligase TRIM62-like [Tympanuchus pallidicinctus]|uniref:E3 ubiquitin-protein ligase TRIM62-like n=1 Tax=Tympanuchus pallidicinctus TaxID=109042 RepID=UPI00228744C7|nr:E3 ubiquitin-protein ligase TRIM62-like [Tympanuchus pallidicinctus]